MNSTAKPDFDLEQFEEIADAETFFEILAVPYEPDVLIHKRIHLLKLFQQELAEYGDAPSYENSQVALKKAYCKIQAGQKAKLAASGCQSCTKCED